MAHETLAAISSAFPDLSPGVVKYLFDLLSDSGRYARGSLPDADMELKRIATLLCSPGDVEGLGEYGHGEKVMYAEYVNMGDDCNTTILYSYETKHFYLTTVADYQEKRSKR